MSHLVLPENSHQFTASIVADCRQMIAMGIWDIPIMRLEGWLNQFCSEEERFFSACLLDQLIYRTSKQFEAGILGLFRSNLNGAVCRGAPDHALTQMLAGWEEKNIRLVPVISDSDPPTKSGPLVLRRIERLLNVRRKWMLWPWKALEQIKNGDICTLIFIDDFLGSGQQFESFFSTWGFNGVTSGIHCVYAPVLAHQNGINHLNGAIPDLLITSAEVLDETHGFFSEAVWGRLGQGVVSAEDAKNWYESFETLHGFKPTAVKSHGVGELGLALGLSHATPNNSLPILWATTNGWHPLLER